MCIDPDRCASATSLGKTLRSVYSLSVASPADSRVEWWFLDALFSVSMSAATSWTGSPRRVSLWRYSSRPFSIRMALTTSLTRGAVRYLILDFSSRFSVSFAAFCARSAGIFASLISESAILFTSNSSNARREVRTSSPLGLVAFFSTRSATSMTILPSSVRQYFLASTSVSIRSVLSRNFRWYANLPASLLWLSFREFISWV